MNGRRAVHFLVNANAIIPSIAFVSNLGCYATLVKSTRGQTTFPILETVNHDSLAAVEFPLLRDRLACDLLAPSLELAGGLAASRITGGYELMTDCMLLIMHLLNRILSRFD